MTSVPNLKFADRIPIPIISLCHLRLRSNTLYSSEYMHQSATSPHPNVLTDDKNIIIDDSE
ncbi:unnamed protein product [Brugia timori]|uniref:Ovule protein n=1 Tax=Brugia timori TaxID=42155 RepID=A0A0R3RBX4_9BILA|nr:unnamed protein product [Brugia timori]